MYGEGCGAKSTGESLISSMQSKFIPIMTAVVLGTCSHNSRDQENIKVEMSTAGGINALSNVNGQLGRRQL